MRAANRKLAKSRPWFIAPAPENAQSNSRTSTGAVREFIPLKIRPRCHAANSKFRSLIVTLPIVDQGRAVP